MNVSTTVSKRNRASKRSQKGLAAVEMTIILPVMLMMFIATAEVGKFLYDYNTLTKAERNGARFLAANAQVGKAGDAAADTGVGGYAYRATNLIVYGDITSGGTPLLNGLSIDDVTITAPTDELIQVSVTYDYTPIMFATFAGFGFNQTNLQIPITSTVTMRALRGG